MPEPAPAGFRITPMSSQNASVTSGIDVGYSYQSSLTSAPSIKESQTEVMRDGIDELRETEYPQLQGKVYLDHAGTTLYAKSLVYAFSIDMITNLYGNPHSESSPSAFAGHKIDHIRQQTLRFFNADPEHWDLVFVSNATAAIKLALECFHDYAASTNQSLWYGCHKDAHTSLVGGRSLADNHHCFTNDEEVEKWIQSGCESRKRRSKQVQLFAYPGQSNMTGRRLPLEWCSRIKTASSSRSTYTLLDAAALATTAPLNLCNPQTSPDLIALSFYKIFGFPNLGALLVQKSCKHILERKKYFGGGTVDMVITINDTWHAKKDTSLHDQLEDGTLPFHAIFALGHAMEIHEKLYGLNPMYQISQRTATMVKALYDQLIQLRHSNGRPMICVYKDSRSEYGNARTQGATIALNVLRADGSLVGYADVEKEADRSNIYVRSGSLCNPGGLATHLEWSAQQMKQAYEGGHRCSDPIQSVFGKPTGVVRASLGAMSTMADVQAFVNFVSSTYRDTTSYKEAESWLVPASYFDPYDSSESQTVTKIPRLGLRRFFQCWKI